MLKTKMAIMISPHRGGLAAKSRHARHIGVRSCVSSGTVLPRQYSTLVEHVDAKPLRKIGTGGKEFGYNATSGKGLGRPGFIPRSEEHTSELQSLMRISYAVCCLKKKIHLHMKPLATPTTSDTQTLHMTSKQYEI